MGLKICEKRCDQCLFSPARIVTKARMAEIIQKTRQAGSYFICHKTNESMCRGWFEQEPPSQMERIAGRIGAIEFVK